MKILTNEIKASISVTNSEGFVTLPKISTKTSIKSTIETMHYGMKGFFRVHATNLMRFIIRDTTIGRKKMDFKA